MQGTTPYFPTRTSYAAVKKETRNSINEGGKVQTDSSVDGGQVNLLVLVLLPTALVLIKDVTGVMQPYRALLDSGSQTSLITERCIQGLGLRRKNSRTIIRGLDTNSHSAKVSRGVVIIDVGSRLNSTVYQTSALIVDQITCLLPVQEIDISLYDSLRRMDLTDPNFYRSGKIDLLIGADIFFAALKDGEELINGLVARSTTFGWMLGGRVGVQSCGPLVHLGMKDIDASLRKFWEMEDCVFKLEEIDKTDPIELHYEQTHQRLESGRYMVRLPLLANISELGSCKEASLSRLGVLERKLNRNVELKRDYHEFMREYIALGHMREVDITKTSQIVEQRHYLPHHAVLKLDSTTTKLRVVFDASCTSTSGLSLNQTLMIGPVIQPDLVSLLMKFRLHRIGLCADITKMYRQIMMNDSDIKYQTILWRFNADEQIRYYELLTLTYGTALASFLAMRTQTAGSG